MSELLGRAIRILDVLAGADTELSIRDIAERTALPKSTVQRLLRGLVEADLARQQTTQHYRLGPKALTLGMAYLGQRDLRTVALPHLARLRDRTGETTGLSVRVGDEMYHIEQVQSAGDLRRTFAIGAAHPLWAGAPARALLAGLADDDVHRILRARRPAEITPVNPPSADALMDGIRQARELGYASALEETVAGVNTLTAVLGQVARGYVPATISVTGPSLRFTPEAMDACLPDLLDAARAISSELGHT